MATFPASIGYATPVGAAKGHATTVPFVMSENLSISISWDRVQAGQPITGYTRPRPAEGMSFVISPCPMDLREAMTTPPANDHYLAEACRRGLAAGGLTLSSLPEAQGSFTACYLAPGQTYYMTVAPRTLGNFDPSHHSCAAVPNSAQGCDVNATHRPAQ